MSTDRLLFAAAVLLTVTAAAIGVAHRLKLGSIGALLVVGIVLGPHSPMPLLTSHLSDLQALGEIGVMLLIFIVGLDTQPGMLWSMRNWVLGFGSIEYLAASVAIAVFLLVVSKSIGNPPWSSAWVLP